MIALLLAGMVVVCSPCTAQEDAWAQIWTELDRLHEPRLAPAEAEGLRAHLAEAARALAGDVRAGLLRAQLVRLRGGDPSAMARDLAALQPDPFTPREHWFLAECVGGELRVGLVLAALTAPSELEQWQLFLAFNTAVDEARALRLEGALALQEQLHERYQTDWSARDLSWTLKNLGRQAEADRVLADTIARESAAGRRPKDLWESRGILALGLGDERLARDYLGRAMALGSDQAALLLARLDLMAGNTVVARTGFRALILDVPPADWAWRGWGTALLAPARAASATVRPFQEP